MDEIWKPVQGFENEYEVSNAGNVRSLQKLVRYVHAVSGEEHFRKIGCRLMKPQLSDNGYLVIYLCRNGKRKRSYIHRLVAEAFLSLNPALVVDHIDKNKTNNAVWNLRCVTQKENVIASVDSMRKPRQKCKKSNTGEKYISKRLDGNYRFSIGGHICRQFRTLEEAKVAKEVFLDGKKSVAG